MAVWEVDGKKTDSLAAKTLAGEQLGLNSFRIVKSGECTIEVRPGNYAFYTMVTTDMERHPAVIAYAYYPETNVGHHLPLYNMAGITAPLTIYDAIYYKVFNNAVMFQYATFDTNTEQDFDLRIKYYFLREDMTEE